MLLTMPLPFVEAFVEELDNGLRVHESEAGLSFTQRKWIEFGLMGLLVTNSLCWARFERASLGQYKQSALSWMFHHAQITWMLVLQVSVGIVLREHGRARRDTDTNSPNERYGLDEYSF